MSTPEGRVLRGCLDYLALAGIFHFRNNNAPVPIKVKEGGAWRMKGFRKSATPGLPDIIGICTVRGAGVWAMPLAVEVKSARGKQSPAQRDFELRWGAAGGLYLLVRSVEELRGGLRDAGVKAP